MPHVATSPADLLETIRPSAHLDGARLAIDDEATFRDTAIRDLAWTAAFSTDEATTAAAQWLVWEASQALGATSASIQELYAAGANTYIEKPQDFGRFVEVLQVIQRYWLDTALLPHQG